MHDVGTSSTDLASDHSIDASGLTFSLPFIRVPGVAASAVLNFGRTRSTFQACMNLNSGPLSSCGLLAFFLLKEAVERRN